MKASAGTIRILQTVNINLSVFILGMSCSMYGASLLDLAEIYGTSVEAISYTLSTRAVGSICGGICGSVVFRLLNSQLVTAICVLFGGIATLLIPLSPSLLFLHVASFVLGSVLSTLEVGNHVWLQVIWKDKSSPQLQLYNFVFGIGGVIAPFICEPFLSSNVQGSESEPIQTGSNGTLILWNDILARNSEFDHSLASNKPPMEAIRPESRIHLAYSIIAAVFFLNLTSYLLSYRLDSADPKPQKDITATDKDQAKKPKYVIVALLAIYMLIGVSDEIIWTAYLPTFVVRHKTLRWSKSAGAFISSAFWLSYTASRLIATLLTLYLRPEKLILIFQSILMIASIGTLLYVDVSPVIIWLGTITISFGLSPYFGNATIWGVQYILLTHGCMSVLMVCVCTGAVLPGLLVGPFIDNWPMIVLWSHMMFATGLTVCGVVLVLYGNTPQLRAIAQKKLDGERAKKEYGYSSERDPFNENTAIKMTGF